MTDITLYFKLYGKEIYRYLRRLLNDEETAKDILQETFLRAMRVSIDEEKAKSYLFKIAHNLAMDYYKEKNKYVDWYEYTEEIDNHNPWEMVHKEDMLKPLSPIERSILTLHYYEGYSYEEISEKLNIPLNTVKSHVYRAKKKIYNYLKDGVK